MADFKSAYRIEYLAVLACSDELLDSLAEMSDLSGITDSLLIYSLLPPQNDFLVSGEKTSRSRAQQIVSAVLHKLKFRPELYFKPFENVLRSFNLSVICNRLDQKLGK